MSNQKTKRFCKRVKRKRWHRQNNPKRATFAQHVGTTSKIAEHEAKIAEHEQKKVFIEARLSAILTAEDRAKYHVLRVRGLS